MLIWVRVRVGGAPVAQSSWVCLREGGKKPQEAKDIGLFIVEVNMGSRLERVLL